MAVGLAALPAMGADLKDPYFGEALYQAYQGQYFDALERLDTELAQYRGLDEPELDTLHFHINGAEFSVGDFELDYRMHLRAGRAIKAVLEGAVDEAVRNEAGKKIIQNYTIDFGKCNWCRLCEEACPTNPKSVHHTNEYEMMFMSRDDFKITWLKDDKGTPLVPVNAAGKPMGIY